MFIIFMKNNDSPAIQPHAAPCNHTHYHTTIANLTLENKLKRNCLGNEEVKVSHNNTSALAEKVKP